MCNSRGKGTRLLRRTEALLIALRNEEGHSNVSEAPKAFRGWRKIERINEWRGKVLHGQVLRQTEAVREKASLTYYGKEISRKKRRG